MNKKLSKEEINDIKELYINIKRFQERDIEEKRVVLTKLPKDKVIWY